MISFLFYNLSFLTNFYFYAWVSFCIHRRRSTYCSAAGPIGQRFLYCAVIGQFQLDPCSSLCYLIAEQPCWGSSLQRACGCRILIEFYPSRSLFRRNFVRKWQRNVKLQKGYVNVRFSSICRLHNVQLFSCRFSIHFVGGESWRLDRVCRGTFYFLFYVTYPSCYSGCINQKCIMYPAIYGRSGLLFVISAYYNSVVLFNTYALTWPSFDLPRAKTPRINRTRRKTLRRRK